jgi:hypothetical protein
MSENVTNDKRGEIDRRFPGGDKAILGIFRCDLRVGETIKDVFEGLILAASKKSRNWNKDIPLRHWGLIIDDFVVEFTYHGRGVVLWHKLKVCCVRLRIFFY